MGIGHSGSSTAWTADSIDGLLAQGVGESESEIEIWDSADDVVVIVHGDIKHRWTKGRQVLPDIKAASRLRGLPLRS